ncbi:MAG: CAP domain-containing protein [Cyanobacteria bacterium P01_D01_bin.1]
MRWTTLCSLALAGLVATGCGSGSEESPQKTSQKITSSSQPVPKVSNSCVPLRGFFSELLELTNQARAEVNADPLRFSFQLGQSAQAYAEDLATQNFFSHKGKDGSTFDSRIAAKGYDFAVAGENLTAGSNFTARNAFDAWMNSNEGHRENLLSKSFSEVGFGLYDTTGNSTYGRYWVQHLGMPKSGRSKGGIYIPDECGLATAAPSAAPIVSAVAGRSTFGDRSGLPGAIPASLLATEVEKLFSVHSRPANSRPEKGHSTGSYGAQELDAKAVPEPASVMGLCVLGVALWRRRR